MEEPREQLRAQPLVHRKQLLRPRPAALALHVVLHVPVHDAVHDVLVALEHAEHLELLPDAEVEERGWELDVARPGGRLVEGEADEALKPNVEGGREGRV
jgi:hypothetical protein